MSLSEIIAQSDWFDVSFSIKPETCKNVSSMSCRTKNITRMNGKMKSIEASGEIKSDKTIDSCGLKNPTQTNVTLTAMSNIDQTQHQTMYAISAIFDLLFCVSCFGILLLCLANNANTLLSATIALIIAVARPMTAATRIMFWVISFSSNVKSSRCEPTALAQHERVISH